MIFTKILPQILKNGLTHQIMMKEEDKTIPLPTEKKKKKKVIGLIKDGTGCKIINE